MSTRATDRLEPVRGIWDEFYEPDYTPDGVRQIVREEIDHAVHNPSVSNLVLDGSLPIEKLRTNSTYVYLQPDASGGYTITATDWEEVDSVRLAGTINVSGKLKVLIQANFTAVSIITGGTLKLSITWDGAEVTNSVNGLFFYNVETPGGATFFTVIEDPTPGLHRFAIVANRATTNGTIYNDANNSGRIFAMETP